MINRTMGECLVELRPGDRAAWEPVEFTCSISLLRRDSYTREGVRSWGATPEAAFAEAKQKAEELLDRGIQRLEEQLKEERRYKAETMAQIEQARQVLVYAQAAKEKA